MTRCSWTGRKKQNKYFTPGAAQFQADIYSGWTQQAQVESTPSSCKRAKERKWGPQLQKKPEKKEKSAMEREKRNTKRKGRNEEIK